MNMPDQRFERLCIEEYKALRAESLRCGGIISNTIWVGVTQYAVTCITVFIRKIDFFVPLLITLLMLESIAATAMFLSEVFKYSRIGWYLRFKIEKSFAAKDPMTLEFRMPIEWEHWIQDKRSEIFYVASLFALQLPIIISLFILLFLIKVNFLRDVLVFPDHISNMALLLFFYILIGIDMIMVSIMTIRIVYDDKK